MSLRIPTASSSMNTSCSSLQSNLRFTILVKTATPVFRKWLSPSHTIFSNLTTTKSVHALVVLPLKNHHFPGTGRIRSVLSSAEPSSTVHMRRLRGRNPHTGFSRTGIRNRRPKYCFRDSAFRSVLQLLL